MTSLPQKKEHENIVRWSRKTFTTLCGIAKGVSNEIIELLMGMNIDNRIVEKIQKAERKWQNRIERNQEVLEQDRGEILPKVNLRLVPESIVKVINILDKAYCKNPACNRERLTRNHVNVHHNHDIGIVNIKSDLKALMSKGQATKEIQIIAGKLTKKYDSIYEILNNL